MQRKRGEQLEQTIYEAALKLFDEEGIEAVTFYKVAELAQTSRGVLYRRWDTPGDLLFDAVHHWAHEKADYPIDFTDDSFPDMGSLREDLLENARRNERLHHALSKYLLKFSMYQMAANGSVIGDDIRDDATSGAIQLGTMLAKRAIERGELAAVPPKEVLMLLGNLRRYYTFMAPNQEPSVETLVDKLVLPAWLATKKD
ncbi:MAG TPA: TetR/AcrR family transcriptional regulator [Lactobacillaceae bacterium]|jgi:AcrR family transcriptional regulator